MTTVVATVAGSASTPAGPQSPEVIDGDAYLAGIGVLVAGAGSCAANVARRRRPIPRPPSG